jgi:hypothetical protein
MAACTPETTNFPQNCIAVKYLRGICGEAVLQIQDPRYYKYGETTNEEDHVFRGTFECSSDLDALEKRALFYVELNPQNFNNNCANCDATVLYSGSKYYSVRVHQNCNSMESN